MLETFGNQICFAYRHFPLSTIHPHAQTAAEAAGAQGRVWQMHAMLFANQDQLDDEGLMAMARRIGLDIRVFAAALEGGTYQPKVREDFMSGVRSGVNGTPTFFINGVRHNGGYDAASLLHALQVVA